MPVRALPEKADLHHLKAQAKDLRKAHAARSMMAAQRLREFHPRFRQMEDAAVFAAELTQADALLATAREYGFASWTRLKAHVEGPRKPSRWSRPQQEWIADPVFRRAVDLMDAGDAVALRALLQEQPWLIRHTVTFEGGNYFHAPTLLNFVAENPVRHGKLPANIVDGLQVLLEAKPDQDSIDETLMLVATGRVPRECGVQREMIAVLCAAGADPNEAARAAAVLNEPDAVSALLEHGARVTLPIAAAMNLPLEDLLTEASAEDLQVALAVAAHYGRVEAVAALLDAGAVADRYNPPGGHAHATPLHLAVDGGHAAVVRLLLERGARTDVKDVLWGATPLGWAEHGGLVEIAGMLREADLRG